MRAAACRGCHVNCAHATLRLMRGHRVARSAGWSQTQSWLGASLSLPPAVPAPRSKQALERRHGLRSPPPEGDQQCKKGSRGWRGRNKH